MKQHLANKLPILLCLVFGTLAAIGYQVNIQLHGTGLFRKGWVEILPARDRGEISMPVEIINAYPVVRNWEGNFYAFGVYCADAYCWAPLEYQAAQDCFVIQPHSFCVSIEQDPLTTCDTSLFPFWGFNHPPQGLIGCLVEEDAFSTKKGITIVGQDQNGGVWMFKRIGTGNNLFTLAVTFASALLAGLLGWLGGYWKQKAH